MDAVFGPAGALARVLPGYEAREEQAELAHAVERALAGGRHLLAEAGTGTGKSLAYLVPALDSGLRVVVSTATKALQQQLLAKDVPLAAAALGRAVDVAVLKGRHNYLCRHRLHGFELLGGAAFARDDDGRAFDELLRGWVERTETGDRAELAVEPSETLWSELAVGADRCLGRSCAFVGTCFSEAARERAQRADLVIANHALYFADLGLRERRDGAGVLPDHDAVVFDEAHKLEDVAAVWLGGRVSGAGLHRLAGDVDRACRQAGVPSPARQLDRVERAAASLLGAVCPQAGRLRLRRPPRAPLRALAQRLVELAASLAGRGDELDSLAGRALATAADAEACLDPGELERVVWAEPDTVVWAPVDVSRELRERLWDVGPTAVLVSATLGAAGSFAFVRERLGLRAADELRVGSPFRFDEQARLYLPPGMPDPRAGGALERVAEETAELCTASRGRALVLTSSYRALDAIAARLRTCLEQAVLVQGDAPRERLLERFAQEVDSVLVATATFWQGVDVPGESLSLLVVDKLPFPPPGDPLVEARCERIAAEGGDWFLDYLLPAAVLQLRQGFGRLIRSHRDRGVVAILDPRVRTRPYGRVFLGSLPPCPLVSDRVAVTDFLCAEVPLTAC
ncbi:MAG TPA: ATP-dependent DNA helicase [Gaiellaceae bacterium]|nr:ATP-dependent DNA helicase [Gaiellaceae bacterium]